MLTATFAKVLLSHGERFFDIVQMPCHGDVLRHAEEHTQPIADDQRLDQQVSTFGAERSQPFDGVIQFETQRG